METLHTSIIYARLTPLHKKWKIAYVPFMQRCNLCIKEIFTLFHKLCKTTCLPLKMEGLSCSIQILLKLCIEGKVYFLHNLWRDATLPLNFLDAKVQPFHKKWKDIQSSWIQMCILSMNGNMLVPLPRFF